MALATRKSSDIFNKNTGEDRDSKSIDTSTETEIRTKFDNADHILDEGMFENLAPALYAIQQLSEDIEELRRYVQAEITSITSAQAKINSLDGNYVSPAQYRPGWQTVFEDIYHVFINQNQRSLGSHNDHRLREELPNGTLNLRTGASVFFAINKKGWQGHLFRIEIHFLGPFHMGSSIPHQ